MKINWVFLVILFLGFVSNLSFSDEPSHIYSAAEWVLGKPHYDFSKNPLDRQKIELGKRLFFDTRFSANSMISCASCHSPFNAFAHTDHDLSHGVFDSIGIRNAPALFNLAWKRDFMWDGAIKHLDMQALAPLHSKTEMGTSIQELVKFLNKDSIYQSQFQQVFNDSNITGERVLKSLSQFQLTLISINSKYDRVQKGEDSFSIQEANGYKLFKKHCNSCHTEPLFTNHSFANNGLAIDTTLNDYGKMRITQNLSDSLKFKIPSLRNLSYTFPYMHDGRFKKLYQVLNHYTEDIKNTEFIDHRLAGGIQISENEKIDIIAFLLTLNDKEFTQNRNHRIY